MRFFYLDAYLLVLVTALTTVLCMFGPRYAPYLGLVDQPGGRKLHSRPTPLLGGLALILIFMPSLLWIAGFAADTVRPSAWALAGCTAAIATLGLMDDRFLLGPGKRLLISAGLFGITCYAVPQFNITIINWNGQSHGLPLGPFGWIATTLSLLALINAVNMADGKNGLVLGLSLGWLILLGIAAPANMIAPIAILLVIVFVLLAFNLGDRLFLGDGGSYGLASGIGLLAVYVYQHSPILRSADQVGLMFMVPVGDMIRLMISRARAGKSPFTPDRDHLHHHLLDRFGWRRGLVIYQLLGLLPAALAVCVPHLTLLIILCTFVAYWVIIFFAHRSRRSMEG
ncbi:glycosyltransferase family 4 protein [Sphingomonas cavernae]|nr:MraY family glycosyltransferase [Sphingomonas cavernae]